MSLTKEGVNTSGPESLVWRAESEKIQVSRSEMQGGADPVMLRAYSGPFKGATAFFRNRPLLETVVRYLAVVCKAQGRCRVLFHACSVGAEPYSLAYWWREHFTGRTILPLEIIATDIAPTFVETARNAVYPLGVLAGMTEREKCWFEPYGDGTRVSEDVRAMVRFLPAMSFVDGDHGGEYDAAFVMNALTYVTPDQQHETVQRLARCTRRLLGLTAFHPDTIKVDVTAAGFHPFANQRRAIYEAWGDRLSAGLITPGTSEYSWRLPPYNAPVPDRDYRLNSLFVRGAVRSPAQPTTV